MLTILPAGIREIPVIREIAKCSWQVAYKDILAPAQMNYMLDKLYSFETLQFQHDKLNFNPYWHWMKKYLLDLLPGLSKRILKMFTVFIKYIFFPASKAKAQEGIYWNILFLK